MTPNEYQEAAARTICDQWAAQSRMNIFNPAYIQINHAVVGLAGEVGELAGTLERAVYYGRPLDVNNLFEELGDCLWYIAEMCGACNFKLEDVMAANVAKLRKRYPDKYTDHHAAEENRDRAAEAKAMERPEPEQLPDSARPHSSHTWAEDKPQTRCVKCGAYKHLSSGFFPCRQVENPPVRTDGGGRNA